jgi:hypothetical protein
MVTVQYYAELNKVLQTSVEFPLIEDAGFEMAGEFLNGDISKVMRLGAAIRTLVTTTTVP